MPQQTFTVSENVQITIRSCHHRVTVWGWDNPNTVAVDVAARQEGDAIIVENVSKVTLRVPRTATCLIADCEADVRLDDLAGRVELSHIGGDVALRGLKGETLVRDLDGDLIARGVASLKGQGAWEGDVAVRGVERLQVESVEGDASLGDVGEIELTKLEGDLSARDIRGPLAVQDVEGDVSLRDVGDIRIAHAGDDFVVAGARGLLEVGDIEGDAVVSLETVHPISLRADGDIVLNFPEEANADVELDTLHGEVTAHAGINIVEQDDDHLRGTLGRGGVPVQVESTHGDIVMRAGQAPEERHRHRWRRVDDTHWTDMGHRIANEALQAVEESLGEFGIHAQHHKHRHGVRGHRHEGRPEPRPAPEPETPRGPAAGSPERKDILDAIARGELSVDDAIRKLRGE